MRAGAQNLPVQLGRRPGSACASCLGADKGKEGFFLILPVLDLHQTRFRVPHDVLPCSTSPFSLNQVCCSLYVVVCAQTGPMASGLYPPDIPFLFSGRQTWRSSTTSVWGRDEGSSCRGRMGGLVGDLCVRLHSWCHQVSITWNWKNARVVPVQLLLPLVTDLFRVGVTIFVVLPVVIVCYGLHIVENVLYTFHWYG